MSYGNIVRNLCLWNGPHDRRTDGFSNVCINKCTTYLSFWSKYERRLKLYLKLYPKLWISDILQTQNEWYIDIAINDDGPMEEYSRMLAIMYTGQA